MPVTPLGEDDLPALHHLAQACLDADGGLPLLAHPPLLRSRLLREHTVGIWDDGRLLAAAGLSVDPGGATTSGLVAPDVRRQGLGTHLLVWAEREAGTSALTVVTETCGPDAERLYARRGLTRTFEEAVLCHSLLSLPSIAPPVGVVMTPVDQADPAKLFSAYAGSFADRPGFVEPTAADWLGELTDDEAWRRDLSLLVTARGGAPVAFVNVLGRWVDQVGVVPSWRGRRLGAYLVARALRSLAADSRDPVWLTVNADNPAAELYRRLGFTRYGTRARYARPATSPVRPA